MSQPLRVVIVDDNPDDRMLSRHTIERNFPNAHVEEVIEPEKLERTIEAGGFDVMITDYQLRWSDGLRVLRQVKERHPYTPVIMFTATGTQETAVEAMKGGLDDYVIRSAPHFVRLPAAIRTVLERSESRRRADTAQRETARLLERERVLRAEADAANRAKDEFLALLSHELRTPLNGILGWAKILRERPHDAALTSKALDAIVRNAEAQTQLIADLLEVSEIITGRMRLELSPVDLSTVLANAFDVVQPAADAKQIGLAAEGDWAAHVIQADPSRLRQILWNLLSNAVKFTAPGGRVTASVEWSASHVRLSVADTGVGFTEEFRPLLFSRFTQADISTTRRHGGLGLGLAIVRHLAELHGGTVEAASPGPDAGATFTVTLPLIAATASSTSEPAAADQPRLDGVHILVVDDDDDTRAILRQILEQCGATVEVHRSAREALDALQRRWPHVILTDVAMPDEDGYMLLERIRSLQRSGRARIPIIAVSAYALAANQREAAAGFDAYVEKPVDPTELRRLIASFVGRT
jgi:signal transduction histidine kinase